MSEDFEPPKEAPDMGTIVLMLGLYLIILAFFILLNAISQISEEKAEQTRESVAEGFGFQMEGPKRLRDEVTVTADPVYEEITKEISAIMESHVSVRDFNLMSSGERMALTVDSVDKIFVPGRIRIRPAMADFFTDMADIIENARPGTNITANVLIHSNNKNTDVSGMTPLEFSGRRAALFVRALVERGVLESDIHAATIEKDYDKLQVFFHVQIVNEKEVMEEAKKILLSRNPMMFGGAPQEAEAQQ